MLRWIGKNLNTFLLALMLAITVWVAAVNESDPNEVLEYPRPIELEIVGKNTDLIITNNYIKQVQLTLRAPRSVWADLESDEDSIKAVLDLSGYSVGEHSVAPQIQIGYQPVKIVSISPPSIDIVLEELVTETFPVNLQLSGQPSVGYQTGNASYTPREITVSGPKSLVDRVAVVQGVFDLANINESINEDVSLKVLDEFDQEVGGLTLSANIVQLLIPVSQQGGYRDVAVKVLVEGQVANLHRLTNISVFPPVVTVYSSDPELVTQLSGVLETEALDINGISDDLSARLQLNLPENIQLVGDQTVLVTVGVEAILGSQTIADRPLEVVNLAPGLSAELSSQTVDVIVSGPLSSLEKIGSTDLRVFVDVDGLDVGTHQVTPAFEILIDGVKVESLLPESIEIILKVTPQGTPTPTP